MKRLAAVAVVTAVTLAACGGDDDAPDGSAPPDQPTSAPESGPTGTEPADQADTDDGTVTVTHLYGETVVDGVPERIVSLDMQWTDVLTALGHPPVAAAIDPTRAGWYPWQQSDGIDAIEVGADYSIPYETVATFQPDLIVGSWGIADAAAYETLAAIAPTIALLEERDVDPWEDMAAAAGEFLGEPDAAAALVADRDQAIADLAAELPGLAGKTYALANYVPGDQIYVVADPNDGASQLFAKLGMQIDPELLAMEDGGYGRVELSLENIGELDSDLLLLLTNGAETSDIPGFDALPAVQTGAVSVLEYADIVGLNTPSPLSVPYALELIRPALEAAAGDAAVSDGPRTVEHALGTTEVSGTVERLVVLDSSFLDASIALGVTPVGATAGMTAGQLPEYLEQFVDGGLAAIGDAGMTASPNLEAIAALRPDLILCAKVRHESLYEQLAAIAPTVCSESSGTNWTEQVELTAEALGLRAQASELLAAFETRAAEVGEAIGADGMTARIVRFMPGETRVYGEPTFSGSVLTAVGFDVTGDAPLQWHPEYGMALVSPEEFELLDADVIFATTYGDDGSARGGFEAVWGVLPAVAEGRQFDIEDSTWMTGIGVLGANLILDDLENWLS